MFYYKFKHYYSSIVNYMCNENHLSILELCGLPLNLMHIQLLAKVNVLNIVRNNKFINLYNV